jgi:hypothetical protein
MFVVYVLDFVGQVLVMTIIKFIVFFCVHIFFLITNVLMQMS